MVPPALILLLLALVVSLRLLLLATPTDVVKPVVGPFLPLALSVPLLFLAVLLRPALLLSEPPLSPLPGPLFIAPLVPVPLLPEPC